MSLLVLLEKYKIEGKHRFLGQFLTGSEVIPNLWPIEDDRKIVEQKIYQLQNIFLVLVSNFFSIAE